MKRSIFLSLFILCAMQMQAQAYRSINIVEPDYITINSSEGIVVQDITVNQDKSLTVTLTNTNRSTSGEVKTYSFEWYLSYKGKRVSDYYTESLRCRKTASRTVYIWPNSVPAGYENYVTVQLGREPRKKDRRDDY